MDLPLGWRTDLAVLRLHGSLVTQHAQHLVVRSPDNPSYYWGNCILVTDPDAVDDPVGWLQVFESEFPDSPHRAIGLVREPVDSQSWLAVRLFLDHGDVLVASAPLASAPLAAGYEVRLLDGDADWERSTALRQLAFPAQNDYEARTTVARRAITDGRALSWFGAFHGDELASELGIADCGNGIFRYQSVVTHPDHRRRGLTRHLLGVASAHAASLGATTWVIIADVDGDASRLYRAAGFQHRETAYQVSRVPQPEDEQP